MRTMPTSSALGAVLRHREGLGEALGLVVDAARPDGVDVAPVRLGLGVHRRVAVHLARRGEDEARAMLQRRGRAPAASLRFRPPASRAAGPGSRVVTPGWRSAERRRPGPTRARRALTSATTSSKAASPASAATFSATPVDRSSTATTWSPRRTSASHKWEPRNPAPPVTTTRRPPAPAAPGLVTAYPGPRTRSPCAAWRQGRAGCGRRPRGAGRGGPAPWRSRARVAPPTR